MEAAGLAFGVFTAFKDVYLTAKFIRSTAQSIKNFHSEQSSLVTRLNVQIMRLKNFSRLFRMNENEVDMRLLEAVPNQYLMTVHSVLGELQQVLAAYAKLAASLDEDYQKYSPASPYFAIGNAQHVLRIDDVPTTGEASGDDPKDGNGHEGIVNAKKSKTWYLAIWGGGKTTKTSSRKPVPWRKLSPGVQWLFTKDKLEETLGRFKQWNDELQDLIGMLLNGFGFYEDRSLITRLQADGKTNIFEGHIELNKLADSQSGENSNETSKNDDLIPWSESESKLSSARILVEYKRIQGEHDAGDSNLGRVVKELYAPQLARFLGTAGKHSFRTLPFNSYSWDPNQVQYAFFFDYPPDAGDRTPKSLYDFIVSSEKEPEYKLELKQRFDVAQTLARAIGAFHADGWLHKSIRAHALKFFFSKDNSSCDFSTPYLTDFEFSRPEGGITRLAARAVNIEHDVYRHPDRYGPPTASFRKTHDIYSLGVVLLEIGLWQTAKQMHDDIVEYDFKNNAPAGGVPAQVIKDAFLQDAKDRIAHRMGTNYQEAIVACLDGDWDDYVGGRDFASEFQKRVVEKVDIKAFIG